MATIHQFPAAAALPPSTEGDLSGIHLCLDLMDLAIAESKPSQAQLAYLTERMREHLANIDVANFRADEAARSH
jgi:hypothetical protein